MKKGLSVIKRGTALVMAGALVCGCATGVAAQTNVKKDETVYVTLSSDGSVQSQTDSVWLHSDSGLSGYSADSGLSDVTMLKDTDTPEMNGSAMTFADGTDAYYQGSADAQLPISTQITYTLDGAEMTAEEMAGKSGHLVMHITFTNNSYKMKTVGGESRRICTPFVTVVAATLDTDTFADVKAENGTVQTDSSKDLAAFVCLPGMQECFDGLLTGDLSEIGDKLHDDVTLEADVTDFSMPMLYIAASTDASDFAQETQLSDFDELFDELDGLDDKLDEMMDGIDRLLDGSDVLNDGASELYSGLQTLDNGASTLQNGAHQAADGAVSAASGAGTLSGGLNTLSGKSQTLRDGTAQIADAVLDSANAQLKEAGVITDDMTWSNYADVLAGVLGVTDGMRAQAKETIRTQAGGLPDAQLNALIYLTAISGGSDFTAAGAQMTQAQADAAASGAIGAAQADLAAAGSDPTAVPTTAAVMKAAAYQTILSQVTAAGVPPESAPLVLVYAMENPVSSDLTANVQNAAAALATTPTDPTVQTAAADLAAAGSADKVAAVDALLNTRIPDAYQTVAAQTGVSDADTNALLITMACRSVAAGSSALTGALAAAGSTLTNAAAVQTAMARANDPADTEAQQLITAFLTGLVKTEKSDDLAKVSAAAAQLQQVQAYVQGINAYTAGVDSAAAGAATLVSGLNTLRDGTAALASGADTLKNGADQLLNGAKTLKDGTDTLVNGVKELSDGVDEAYDKLRNGSSDFSVDELKDLRDTVEALKEQRESYTSFAGDAGSEGSVKFVMKVSAAKTEDTASTEDTTQTEKAGGFAAFWERLVALFRH